MATWSPPTIPVRDATPPPAPPAVAPAADAAASTNGNYRSMGGLFNDLTGMGGELDKAAQTGIRRLYLSCQLLDLIYEQMWAAERFVDMVVIDSFVRGYELDSDAAENTEDYDKAFEQYEVDDVLSRGLKAMRLHGGALVIPIIGESVEALAEPLEDDLIPEGQLKSFQVFDRWACKSESVYFELMDPKFGQVETYRVTAPISGNNAQTVHWLVHASRVIRLDARPKLTPRGWYQSWEWGPSLLQSALTEIMHDEALAEGISHLVHEASMLVLKIQHFNETLKRGRPSPDAPSPAEVGMAVNKFKSSYRTVFIDANDEAKRLEVSFGGLAQLMDKYLERLAVIGGYPLTKFLGRSPGGLNATGESDEHNYSIIVNGFQLGYADKPLRRMHRIVALSEGMEDPPPPRWLPLVVSSEERQIEVDKNRTESVTLALGTHLITEEEARQRLSNTTTFGILEDMTQEELEEMQPDPPPMPSVIPDPDDPNAPPPAEPPPEE